MGKVAKRHVEGRTREKRIAVRKTLGPLKALTVQARTKDRYELARKGFYSFLSRNQIPLPHKRQDLDPLVCQNTLSSYGRLARGGQRQTTRWPDSKTKIPNYVGAYLPPGVFLRHGR